MMQAAAQIDAGTGRMIQGMVQNDAGHITRIL
jgi:hypothetical protein